MVSDMIIMDERDGIQKELIEELKSGPMTGVGECIQIPIPVEEVPAPRFDREPTWTTRARPKLGRNDRCFCGLPKKFKKCCYDSFLGGLYR